ncbi:hypothetical protein BO82DRAFT_387019 [Aspergillus uvarum CBS 121591]|uniref:Uncharacterized protein n=1 Tax=Aspergillus uvarum CBS 121591 TaxID=1448315 RepID=A0A319BZI4_9EURO|nr:hypothetical protein BO82DRAFT_387019 [Aspergillus uvarum CBS 121591]PYH76909.1 hypothetical protein BO82DRAFT_387019 [Aspergillus uvarum CBS 121591]
MLLLWRARPCMISTSLSATLTETDLNCSSFLCHDKETRSLIRALKVISWQIANADTVYRKALSSIDMTSTSNLETLWGMRPTRPHTASANWGKFQLHILLTGQEETMSWVRNHLGAKISVIDLTTKNANDMKKFIESRMDRLDIFGGSSEQVASMRHETLETLLRETQGDFVSAGLLLDEISTKQRPGEIRDISARSRHINELLTWAMFAARPLTLGELESVLSLRCREQSLRPLSKVIIDQYSSLLRVEGRLNGASKEFDLKSRVLLASDPVKHFLDAPVQGGTGMESKVWNDVEAVNESEVRIVRRFLEFVCDASLFHRSGFEGFFVTKLSRSSPKACLEAICSLDRPKMDFLLDYVVELFPDHLEQCDLSSVYPQDNMSIGPYLVALFDDVETNKRWWLTGYSSVRKSRQVWFYKDTYADLVMRWLQDFAVTKNLTGIQSRWGAEADL